MSAHFDLTFLSKQPQPANPKALVVLLHGVGGCETKADFLSWLQSITSGV